MENSKKIAYIIPLHKMDDRVYRAIESIPNDALIVVSIPSNLKDWFKITDRVINIVFNDEKTTYPALVNGGIEHIRNNYDADYINILEFDDVLTPNAHKIINTYANDWEDVDILAPLACVVKWNDGSSPINKNEYDDGKPVLIGTANEAPLAPQIAEEFGYFDFNMMLRTNFMFVNGMYIKPSVFENYGLFKENFKLFYDYEWALRVIYFGSIIRVIPKATHLHSLSEGGAFDTQKALDSKFRDEWLSMARREYFFTEDRNLDS